MPYREIEIVSGRFLWRCDDCGSEQPKTPVPRHQLGVAPYHACPHEGRLHMEGILREQAEAEALTVELHLGDVVEEVASKRRGKIDSMSLNHGPRGQIASVNYWRILFQDGKQPLYGIAKERSEIRLINCPHNENSGESRFVPERGIMG